MALMLMRERAYKVISLYFIVTSKIKMKNTSDFSTGLQK